VVPKLNTQVVSSYVLEVYGKDLSADQGRSKKTKTFTVCLFHFCIQDIKKSCDLQLKQRFLFIQYAIKTMFASSNDLKQKVSKLKSGI
jgi:hypothetical protein